ncbi:MAG: hypothetical protein QOI63_549 [Thermoplasmata archaeon]|jgi:hypothetical protein|nr:hypothetical protein [Thermoplasmata archaeon]
MLGLAVIFSLSLSGCVSPFGQGTQAAPRVFPVVEEGSGTATQADPVAAAPAVANATQAAATTSTTAAAPAPSNAAAAPGPFRVKDVRFDEVATDHVRMSLLAENTNGGDVQASLTGPEGMGSTLGTFMAADVRYTYQAVGLVPGEPYQVQVWGRTPCGDPSGFCRTAVAYQGTVRTLDAPLTVSDVQARGQVQGQSSCFSFSAQVTGSGRIRGQFSWGPGDAPATGWPSRGHTYAYTPRFEGEFGASTCDAGLVPGMTHYLALDLQDDGGQTLHGGPFHFQVPPDPNTPFGNVAVAFPSPGTANVSWEFGGVPDGRATVWYGLHDSLEHQAPPQADSSQPGVLIPGLQPGAVYHYHIERDTGGTVVYSNDLAFQVP